MCDTQAKSYHQLLLETAVHMNDIEQSSWVDLLQWLKMELPTNFERQLLFCPRLLTLGVHTQKAVLTSLIKQMEAVCPNDIISFIKAIKAVEKRDAWVSQLLNLLQEKVLPTRLRVYNFTQRTQNINSALHADIKKLESSKPRNVYHILQSERPSTPEGVPSDTCVETKVKASIQANTSQFSVRNTQPSDTLSTKENTTGISQPVNYTEAFPEELEAAVLADVLSLREAWHTDRLDPNIVPEKVKLLVTLTTQQLDMACCHLKLEELPESSLPAVNQHITSLAERLSHTNATLLAKCLFLKRVLDLTNNAPRGLFSAVTVFAASLPQPTIEGILLPSLVQNNPGGPQADLATRVLKEVFKPQDRTDLFSKLIMSHDKWNEPVISVVQTLLDAKVLVDRPLLSTLIDHLVQVSSDFSRSKQFAKFILTLIQKEGQQMTTGHAVSLKEALQKNSTFLRKPALAALTRLKM